MVKRKKTTKKRKKTRKSKTNNAFISFKNPSNVTVRGVEYAIVGVYRLKSIAQANKKFIHNPKLGVRAFVRKHKNGWALYKN